MRGYHKLFYELFPASVSTDAERKGVRNALIEQRDKALVCRYYYHIHIQRKRYDDALAALEQEFFICASVITKRIGKHTDSLKQLIANKTDTDTLKKEYPHYRW